MRTPRLQRVSYVRGRYAVIAGVLSLTLVLAGVDGSAAAAAAAAIEPTLPSASATPVATPVATPSVDDTVDQTFAGTQDLIIETDPGKTFALVSKLKFLGVEVTQQYDTALAGAAVTVTQQQLAAIQATIDTESISVDKAVTLFNTTTQDAPGWNLDRIDQRDYTPYPGVRAFTYPDSAGAGVTVFIIDSGFTRKNTELDGRVGIGVDLAGGDHGTPNDASDDSGTSDCNQHGTHVAGTVASTTYGAAKLATIVPVRVFDCSGGSSGSLVVAAIEWVMEHKPAGSPAVINMSLGTTGGDPLIDLATQRAIDAGITVVVAAGNGGDDQYGDDACFGSTNSAGIYENGTSPARVVDAITVGATGYRFNPYPEPVDYHQDLEAFYTNYGTCVDLYAPGGEIPSLAFNSAGTLTLSGTSMASPLVAGVAALYLGQNPLATPADVANALVANATQGKIQRAEEFWPQNYGADFPGYPTFRATHTPNLLLSSVFLNSTAGIPSAPTGLTAGEATITSVPLTWEAPIELNGGEVSNYVVQYRDSLSSQWLTFTDSMSATAGATVTGLSARTTYEFRVAARTAQGDSSYSSPVSTSTLSGLTTVPRSLMAGRARVSSVPLTWSAPSTSNGGTITDYTIQYRRTGTTTWSTFAHTAKATTGATVTGLTPARSYQFRVAARTAQGNSSYTTPVSRSTPSGVTTVPRSLAAGRARVSSVPLTWSAPSTSNGGTITDYKIQYRRTGATVWKTYAHIAKATTGATVTGLSRGRSYQFRVAAHTAQGNSSYTAPVSRTTRMR